MIENPILRGFNADPSGARDIRGPYETHPNKHLLTARFMPDSPLQRAGHGQYIETPTGEVCHTYLCGRPMPGPGGTPFWALGCETGIARCEWHDDGWLYLPGGGLVPPLTLPADAIRTPDASVHRRFDTPDLPIELQWLRTPYPDRLFRLTGQALRLAGRAGSSTGRGSERCRR